MLSSWESMLCNWRCSCCANIQLDFLSKRLSRPLMAVQSMHMVVINTMAASFLFMLDDSIIVIVNQALKANMRVTQNVMVYSMAWGHQILLSLKILTVSISNFQSFSRDCYYEETSSKIMGKASWHWWHEWYLKKAEYVLKIILVATWIIIMFHGHVPVKTNCHVVVWSTLVYRHPRPKSKLVPKCTLSNVLCNELSKALYSEKIKIDALTRCLPSHSVLKRTRTKHTGWYSHVSQKDTNSTI